ncbi:MAG: family 16 glycoside hydrolase [Gemmataceae bacterium]
MRRLVIPLLAACSLAAFPPRPPRRRRSSTTPASCRSSTAKTSPAGTSPRRPGTAARARTSPAAGGWPRDGAIVSQDIKGNGGIVITDKKYTDFEVVLEMNNDDGPDSGLFLRSTEDGKCYQAMIDYHAGGNLVGGGGWASTARGSAASRTCSTSTSSRTCPRSPSASTSRSPAPSQPPSGRRSGSTGSGTR